MTYCDPDDHTWVPVVEGGLLFDHGFDTKVCSICLCYSGVRSADRLRDGETTSRRGKARAGEPHRPIKHIGTGG